MRLFKLGRFESGSPQMGYAAISDRFPSCIVAGGLSRHACPLAFHSVNPRAVRLDRA
ncbi:hypothetical protein BOSEA31B_14395 [Hyphomicrobiales bacterium]|nr:hypothetical protein BOSEA31B_14395 [Hyphomicrobiales bacterium]CAH1700174.1 hypothetical protein BOSEA1005_13227 [Hyphomicrobiales bacterium]CAI0343936.1 hypothetical protein BO1005MUT1_300132 [Hyphomicrobiales bacterium]